MSLNTSAKTLPKKGAPDVPAELPGVVLPQRVRCGKPTCRCASGEAADLHGPYPYRFWRERGRLRKAYVPAALLDATRAACRRRQEREGEARTDRRAFAALLAMFRETVREVERALNLP